MLPPSILAHFMNGGLLLAAIAIGVINYSKLKSLGPYQMLVLVLLFSLAAGVHAVSHALLEKQYNFVPFNLWRLPGITV